MNYFMCFKRLTFSKIHASITGSPNLWTCYLWSFVLKISVPLNNNWNISYWIKINSTGYHKILIQDENFTFVFLHYILFWYWAKTFTFVVCISFKILKINFKVNIIDFGRSKKLFIVFYCKCHLQNERKYHYISIY